MKWKSESLVYVFLGCFCLSCAFLPVEAAGEMQSYNITASWDWSGPFANVMKAWTQGQKIGFAWWNEEVGKKLGVRVNLKGYDIRYDSTVIAGLWPKILSGDKPIAHLPIGGATVMALMKRLPKDKVPLFCSTGTYGFIWGPGHWMIQPRPTYVHEAVGLYAHLAKKWKRKVKVACINTQGIPPFEEFVTGLKKYSETPNSSVDFVGVEWVPVRPVDLTSQVSRLLKKDPDFFDIFTNTSQVVATIRALQRLNKKVPVRMSSHNGIEMSAKAIGSIKDLEGCYDSYSMRPAVDHSIEAYKVFMKYKDRVDEDAKYQTNPMQALMQVAMVLGAVERVARSKGPANVTGEELYKSMFNIELGSEEFLGILNDQYFTHEQPFSTRHLAVMASTVNKGEHVLFSKEWLPIPQIPKW